MNVSVDISLYPLKTAYRQPIIEFIDHLTGRSEIELTYNSMSTTLFGKYSVIMPLLETAFENHLENIPESVFVLKISGGCHTEN